jgi:hypothetical protein
VQRIPLLAGTRVHALEVAPDAVVLLPPAPGRGVADVVAAVRDALRFPLAGEPLEALVPRRGRVTIVVEPPALPIPGSQRDPRQVAIAATVAELERLGVPTSRQTILVAGGLARRAGRDELEALVTPESARRFDGRVEVHDAAADDLVPVSSPTGARVSRALVDTDLVVTVTAAETVLHGGPGALLSAADSGTMRAASADSLLETGRSHGWQLAASLERSLAGRTPVLGVSLALGHPRLGGVLRGYPYDRAAVDRVARSRGRRLYGLLPSALRARILRSLGAELAPVAVLAGPPSVAHAEALLRTIAARATVLERPLDAICLGIPRLTPSLPRERSNPLQAATVALGFALRLWRDAFPVAEGGTAILVHSFERRFVHPTQAPYRAFFAALRGGRSDEALAAAEAEALDDRRAVSAYRDGRACHPLAPFADWEACRPALQRLGTVLVAGCRDAAGARALGFVPVAGVRGAVEMARSRAGGSPRIGFLVAPPWFPLQVGGNALGAKM